MNAEDDPRDLDRECLLCGTWTKSHRVPDGYCCHSCWRDAGETKVILALDAQVVGESVALDERIQGPPWAGGKFRLTKAPFVSVVEDAFDFSTFPHAVYAKHPHTTLPVELAVDEDTAERVREDLDAEELEALP